MQIALNRIMLRTPLPILNTVFAKPLRTSGGMSSIASLIELEIINRFVRPECNLMGGKTTEIVLLESYHVQMPYKPGDIQIGIGNYSIYRVPLEDRDGVGIASVHGIRYPGIYSVAAAAPGYGRGMSMLDLAQQLLDSHTFLTSPARPTCELLNQDTVRIHPPQYNHIDWVMTCQLDYDESFSNLNNSSVDVFAEICVEAVHAFCYNALTLVLNQTKIEFGADIGKFVDVVEGWAESGKRMQELLKQFHGAGFYEHKRLKNLLPHLL
jgi:hypothetical protein